MVSEVSMVTVETMVAEVTMVTVGTMVAEVTIGYYSRKYGCKYSYNRDHGC